MFKAYQKQISNLITLQYKFNINYFDFNLLRFHQNHQSISFKVRLRFLYIYHLFYLCICEFRDQYERQSQFYKFWQIQAQLQMSTWGLEDQISKQNDRTVGLQTYQSAFINQITHTNSKTRFIIRYEEKQHQVPSKDNKNNRYSTKKQYGQIRLNRISQSVLEKSKKDKNGNSVPSYLKPTESSSISAQIEKNRKASMLQINNENKAGALIKLRSKSLEEEDQEAEKQYNRVPIQYFDEKNNGCGADSIRARVIFRGYAPKNTYFYLKTLKPFKRKQKKPSQAIQSSPCIFDQPQSQKTQISPAPSMNLLKNDYDIKFQSKFESGNLAAAAKISQNQYWLYMREDTNTHGLRQWYYFAAMNRKPMKVKFRIYRFTKTYSLYRFGMKPYIRMPTPEGSPQQITEWFQGGQKIKYEFDNQQRCFYMQFQFKFEEENMEVEFAMLPPYTYSMLKQYLRSIQTIQQTSNEGQNQTVITIDNKLESHQKRQQLNRNSSLPSKIKEHDKNTIKVQVSSIGQTLAGLDIPFVKIKEIDSKMDSKHQNKQAIVLLARTHPGETVSNFTLQNFIDTVIGSEQLTQFYDFFIIPMVNPDGVYFGNHRTSVVGQDLNRNFHNTDFDVFPEIQAVNNVINRVKKSHKIRFLIDLHGHSARKNIFAYGDEQEINSSQYLHTRILPKLLNDAISSFKYDYCIFRQSKQKKNTARVYYSTKYKINCLTIEQSYGLLDEGTMGIHVWRNFGVALANCLLQFAQLYANGKEKSLEDYLKDQIQKQKIILEKRMQKHKIMFGILPDQKNVLNSQNKELNQVKSVKDTTNFSKVENKGEKHIKDIEQKPFNKTLGQNQFENENEDEIIQIQGQDDQKSVNMSELSSGDEELQIENEDIEALKKQIIKVGCFKQGMKRQRYNLADKKLQLFQSHSPSSQREQFLSRRLHQQKSSMIPRIVKLQIKRKEDYNLSFKRDYRQNQRDLIEKQRIQRRKQIQAKFKRMELPLIKR